MKTLEIPTLFDIEQARAKISKYLLKTPLRYSAPISKLTSAEVYIKYENHNPTCAFKVRGGVNLISKLLNDKKMLNKTIIVVSTGNHGQSIAYSGKLFGFKVIVVCPQGANESKVQSMKDFGAEVVLYGKDFDEAREYCTKLANEKDYLYIHSANEPDLISGVGTIGLEVYEDLPDIDCFITAIGAGSGVCGSGIALKSKNPDIKIFGVQASGASAVYDSFKQRKMISYPSLNTFAEGLATRETFELPFKIMQKYIDDVFLVTDEELKHSIHLLLEYTHNIAEGAGAASLAALIKNKQIFKEKKVVCVLTGGNLQTNTLKEVLKIKMDE